MKILYLYGLASGPESFKAQFFKNRFSNLASNVDFEIFDYVPDKNTFTNLRTSQLLNNICTYIRLIKDEKLILFGSSYGGLLAYSYVVINPFRISKLILMAPALKFTYDYALNVFGTTETNWKKQQFILVDHYRFGQGVPLNYSFYEDLKSHNPPDFHKISFSVPTLIFHGKNDTIIPIQWSREFERVKNSVKLIALESNHQLLDQKKIMWKKIEEFLCLE